MDQWLTASTGWLKSNQALKIARNLVPEIQRITVLGETTLIGITYSSNFVSCVYVIYEKCGSIFKNEQSLTIRGRSEIAASYEMRNFYVLMHRCPGACKDGHETLRPERNKGYRAKLMITASVNDKRRSGRPFASRSADKVKRALEVFMRSLQKPTHQAARESRLTRHTILSVLQKELSYCPWNLHYVQELSLQTVTAEWNTDY